ncbi:MAG: hypothetical protein ABEJ72_04100 [Candidatus Aenigmatarchaeota archaeon]
MSYEGWELLDEEVCGTANEDENIRQKAEEMALKSFEDKGLTEEITTKKVRGIDSISGEKRTLYKVTDGKLDVYVDPDAVRPIV